MSEKSKTKPDKIELEFPGLVTRVNLLCRVSGYSISPNEDGINGVTKAIVFPWACQMLPTKICQFQRLILSGR
jgi:hypothetical protein